jgi:autophagy-related protein 2
VEGARPSPRTGGKSSQTFTGDASPGEQALPTTVDLAQSFLESEPREEKAELQAAISSQSQYLQRSSTSLSDDDDETGLGNEAVSLPSFIAAFLKGVADRLQIRVTGATIRVDMDLPQDGPVKRTPEGRPDQVTALLSVQDVAIDGVTYPGEEGAASHNTGGRKVTFNTIHAMLVSDAVVFSNYSHFAASPPSPSTTHSKVSHPSTRLDSPSPRSRRSSSRSGSVGNLTHSVILDRPQLNEHSSRTNTNHLDQSTNTLDGRFSDAGTDAEYGVGCTLHDDQVSGSRYDDGDEDVFDNPGYLDEVFHSQCMDDVEDSVVLHPPRSPDSGGTPRPPKPQLGSSQTAETWHDFEKSRVSIHNRDDHDEYTAEDSSKERADCVKPHNPDTREQSPPRSVSSSHVADLIAGSKIVGSGEYSGSSNSSSKSDSSNEDLTESKIFSHEEAASMYMSAISHSSSSYTPDMPGAWESSTSTINRRAPSSAVNAPVTPENVRGSAVLEDQRKEGASTPKPSDHIEKLSANRTDTGKSSFSPKGQSETESSSPSETSTADPEVAHRVISINSISVWIPTDHASDEAAAAEEHSHLQHSRHPSNDMKMSTMSLIPSTMDESIGTSKLDLPLRPRRDSTASYVSYEGPEPKSPTSAETETAEAPPSSREPSNAISIKLKDVGIRFDIATAWLLVKVGQKLSSVQSGETAFQTRSPNSQPGGREKSQRINFHLESCSIKFLEHLTGVAYHGKTKGLASSYQSFSSVENVILQASVSKAKAELSTANEVTKFELELANFIFGCASEEFISFDKDLRMRDSVRDVLSPVHSDLSFSVVKTTRSARANLTTLPIHLNLNIQRLEEILGSFGGLSTILELGSSMASVSTVRGDTVEAPAKPSRGVHFAGVPPAPRPSLSPSTSSPFPWKINARLGGVVVDLVGEKCALRLKTTAVKVVSRFEGIGIQIDKAKLSGPFTPDSLDDSPAKISVANVRVEYLFSPKEVDLDRLLSLLTPSKDKYDEDDDIMLDTLIRQRRQGAVLRITITGVKLVVHDLHELQPLSHLPAEISKLSNVAKYLPEDDRPGIMILALIREFDGQLHVGGKIGELRLVSHDVEAAHISIPSLVAAQVKRITLTRNDEEELVGEALLSSSDQNPAHHALPMLMARFIADEMDPTVKIKLHNFRAEYTVSSISAFLGLSDTATVEDLAANMASSVANLADLHTSRHHHMSPVVSEVKRAEPKPLKLTVALRDCVVGLNPRSIPAKGLAVFTYAKFTGVLPEEQPSEASFDIKRATVMIIDDVQNIDLVGTSRRRSMVAGQSEQVQAFADMGFVPVTFMSSAMVAVKILSPDTDGNKSVDVELRDDLLIMETCADSTQTLISLLNGLAPPTPPSTTVKYRTEIMPIQDMLASFTGDAFATDQASDAESQTHQDNVGDYIDDDLEYVSDFYPPKPDYPDDALSASMMGSTFDISRSRPLLDSFHSEYNMSSSVSGLDFREDHFAKQSTVGGTAHRWDTAHNTYDLANDVKLRGSPLTVRVRDVHFIWNLFDGYDWRRTRDTISRAVKDVEIKATERRARAGSRLSAEEDEEESVIGDFLFNSIYIGIPANKDPRELAKAINQDIDDLASETGSYSTSTTVTGLTARQSQSPSVRGKKLRLARSKHHKMTFELKGISADFVVFPPESGETQSSLDVRVSDLEIFDHIPTSTWKKFATYMYDAGEKESGTSMIHLEILNVKPVAELTASEIVLKVCTSFPFSGFLADLFFQGYGPSIASSRRPGRFRLYESIL